MATAALLFNVECLNAQYNECAQQLLYWTSMYESNAAKLSVQTKQEELYMKAYDDAKDGTRKSDLKMNGRVFIAKETEASDTLADQWAHYKAARYDEALKTELADLDIQYDAMKTMYETMMEKIKADMDPAKQATAASAQDTHLLDK